MAFLPEFVRIRAMEACQYSAIQTWVSVPRPEWTSQMAVEHFISAADQPILARAAKINPHGCRETAYNFPIQPEPGSEKVVHVRLQLRTDIETQWPNVPQSVDCMSPGRSEIAAETNEWARWYLETAKRWTAVHGMIKLIDETFDTLSQLKYVWPDFDLLLGINADKNYTGLKNWQKKFQSIGRPRDMPTLLPDFGDHMEEVRKTVLPMTVMEHVNQSMPFHPITASFHESYINLPWGDHVGANAARGDGFGQCAVAMPSVLQTT